MSFEFRLNGISLGGSIKDVAINEMTAKYNTYAIENRAYRTENREYRKNQLTVQAVIGGQADIEFNKLSNSERGGLNGIISYTRFGVEGNEAYQFTVIAVQKGSKSKLFDKEGAEEVVLITYKVDVLVDDRQVEKI